MDPAPQTEHLGYRMIALEVDDMQKTADYLRTKTITTIAITTNPHGPAAEAFAGRVEAREASALSSGATRSYPARRLHPEPECGLR